MLLQYVYNMERILIIADTHCGSLGGLTHPYYQSKNKNQDQKRAWNFFINGIKKYKPFTHIICNGDLIDGKGIKNSKDQLTTDRELQVEMFCKILQEITTINKHPLKYYFTRGTPSHTSQDGEDWENLIAKQFPNPDGEVNIDNSYLIEIGGKVFHLKHKVGRSNVPWSKPSPLIRSATLKLLEEVWTDQIKADIFIRSHVHYYTYIKLHGLTMITSPCLQYWSSYGQKECEGTIDFGFLVCEINNKNVNWIEYITPQPVVKERILKG